MRCPRGSPRLTSTPLRTRNGLRRRTFESAAGTSTCQPERSFPLKRLCGRPSDAQRGIEPAAVATEIARIRKHFMSAARPRCVISTHALNDYGGTVAKDFRSGTFAHNLGRVITQSHNGIGSHFPGVLNEQIKGLFTCLFAHIRICPDPSSNDVLQAAHDSLGNCRRPYDDSTGNALVFFDPMPFDGESRCNRHVHVGAPLVENGRTSFVATHPAAGMRMIEAGHIHTGCGIVARFPTVATRTKNATINPCVARACVASRAAMYEPIPPARIQPARRSRKA